MSDILLYDSTLRDGAQMANVSFSLEDKLLIAERLDRLGIDYIEGGYATSNPKDMEFFRAVPERGLSHARVTAFGNTRRAKNRVEDDPSILAVLASQAPVATVVGKSWDLHMRDVLRVTPEQNLEMIADSVRYLKSRGLEVIYDAEHFYDGYKGDRDIALRTVLAAAEAGADALVLCDTNGGCLPHEVREITAAVLAETGGGVGFHGHNDSGCAVANTLAAVRAGATHVQGCANGFGERTGNADLFTVIADLQLKMGRRVVSDEQLEMLTEVSRFVYELANLPLVDSQPFTGRNAFTHKGGLHVDAVRKNPATYEHVVPERLGNRRRFLVSELAGGATILHKLEEMGVPSDRELRGRILEAVQDLENQGYQFEMADASFRLLVRRIMGVEEAFFELAGFRTIVEKRSHDGEPITEATVKIRTSEGEELCASEGDGPVNALDGALRKALTRFYPCINEVRLVDFKVRVINARAATAARVLVFIESRDDEDIWGTVGVSENIIEASWQALVDSINYKLLKEQERGRDG